MHYPVPHEKAASELLYYVESGAIEDLAPLSGEEEDRLVARAHVHALLALVDRLPEAAVPASAPGRTEGDEV